MRSGWHGSVRLWRRRKWWRRIGCFDACARVFARSRTEHDRPGLSEPEPHANTDAGTYSDAGADASTCAFSGTGTSAYANPCAYTNTDGGTFSNTNANTFPDRDA